MNTQNPMSDNNEPISDYNSVQPQSVPSDTSTMEPSAIDALGQEPEYMNTQDDATTPVMEEVSTPTPTMEEVSTPTPVMEEVISTPTPTMEEVISTPTPTMEENQSSVDIYAQSTMDTTSSIPNSFGSESLPSMEESPSVNGISSLEQGTDTLDSSLNLNEPLSNTAVQESTPIQEVSAPVEDIVATLDKTEKGEGGSKAVVIILIVIILLLLAGIGYFGYKIFLA